MTQRSAAGKDEQPLRGGWPQQVLAGGSYSQTLSRGLRVLEILAVQEKPMSVVEVAIALGVHRSVAYRLLRTCEEHRLVTAGVDGRYTLGLGLVTLARGVYRDETTAAFPVLTELAERVSATAFLGVADDDDVVCLVSVAPRRAMLHVAYRQGLRHPLDVGASGLAILAGRAPRPGERSEVAKARQRGYARSEREVERSTIGIAAPVVVPGREVQSSITAILLQGHAVDEDTVAFEVMRAADRVAAMA